MIHIPVVKHKKIAASVKTAKNDIMIFLLKCFL